MYFCCGAVQFPDVLAPVLLSCICCFAVASFVPCFAPVPPLFVERVLRWLTQELRFTAHFRRVFASGVGV